MMVETWMHHYVDPIEMGALYIFWLIQIVFQTYTIIVYLKPTRYKPFCKWFWVIMSTVIIFIHVMFLSFAMADTHVC